MLTMKYEHLETLDSNHQNINHQLLLQEENFIIHEIELTDKLMNELKDKKITREQYNRLLCAAEATGGRFPMVWPESTGYKRKLLLERLERGPWYVRVVDFFEKVLWTPRYKRKQISLNLRKLRSKLRGPHHQFFDNEHAAVYRLSTLDYYGFDFSNQEASLIEKMLEDSFPLTIADLDLINKITRLQAAQIPMKLSELEVYFSHIPTESYDPTISKILGALHILQDQRNILNKWSKDKTKLVNKLDRMREMNETPPLRLDGSTKMILEHVLDESRRSDEIKPYAKTHIMLGIQSRLSSDAEIFIKNMLTLAMRNNAEGLSSTLVPLSNLPADQKAVVYRCVDNYDHAWDSGKRLIKHAQVIGRAGKFLEVKHSTLGESAAMLREGVAGLEKLGSMDTLPEQDNLLLRGIKAKGDQSFTQWQKEVKKLAMEGVMLETEDLPIRLQELLSAQECPRIQGIHPLKYPPKESHMKTRPVLRTNEIEELVDIALNPEITPKIQDETKAMTMLKILIQAEYRSHNKSKRLLEKLAEILNEEIKLAKSKYQSINDNMIAFESIKNFPGLEKVLHKLDPDLSA
jgi:hypothetical protein